MKTRKLTAFLLAGILLVCAGCQVTPIISETSTNAPTEQTETEAQPLVRNILEFEETPDEIPAIVNICSEDQSVETYRYR